MAFTKITSMSISPSGTAAIASANGRCGMRPISFRSRASAPRRRRRARNEVVARAALVEQGGRIILPSSAASLPPAPGSPPPWGLLGTIAWGALGVGAWFAVQFAVIIAVIVWRDTTAPGTVDMHKMANDGFLLAFVTIMAAPAWIGVSVVAARLRKWRARDYLALVQPRRGEVAFGVAVLAALLVASDLFTLLVGREVVPGFMREAYLSARNSGALALFFLAVVIVAPVSEEIAFRGFLFRGLSASWLGVSGAIIATSA